MAQKSKAASLTPDLLTSRSAPAHPAPRKQAADLSLAPPPAASQPEPTKGSASGPKAGQSEPAKAPPAKAPPATQTSQADTAKPPPEAKAGQPEPAKPVSPPVEAKSKGADPAPEPMPESAPESTPESAPEQTSEDAPSVKARSDVASAPPSSSAIATDVESTPTQPNGGDGKTVVADQQPESEAHSDYRIQIPVPLNPSEHLELTLAAARSGRSCQEIIVEALFRYLEDIAGPPDGPAGRGPDAQS